MENLISNQTNQKNEIQLIFFLYKDKTYQILKNIIFCYKVKQKYKNLLHLY